MADLEQLVLSISADTRQMQKALDRLIGQTKQAADGVDAAFSKAPPSIDNVAKSINKTKFETANLAAQFQDIAVQLQGGQNPFTIALQQGTQINQVLGRSGAGGVVNLLGTAFASLLTPVSLATIGIIALGGFAVQYASKAIGAVDDLDDKLKRHGELIKSLKDAYGEAGKGIDVAVNESIAVLKTLLGLSTTDLQKQFRNLANSAVASMTDFNQLGDAAGQSVETTSKKFAAFKGPIDDLRASIESGTPKVKDFRAAVSQIEQSTADEKTKKLAKELLDATESASKAELAILGTAKATRRLSADALAAADAGEAFSKSLNALNKTVSPDLDDRQKVMKAYNDALEKATGTEERLAAARARDTQLGIISDNEKKKAAEDAAKEAESNRKRFENSLQNAGKSTAGVDASTEALGKGAGALAELRTQAKLTEDAQKAFGTVTQKTADQIQDAAQDAGEAADAYARAKVASQTDFSTKTAFLTPQDLQIAQQLSSIYGNDVPAALASTEAAGIRAAQGLRSISTTLQDVNRGLFTDFTQQIRNGASAMDALKTAGTNALGKIADKLVSMAADNLWASAFGGSSGLGGFFGSLFGGGSKLVTGAAGGLAVPTFATGTASSPAGIALVGEKGPELVRLPGGSQVIPNHMLPSVPTSGGGDNMAITVQAGSTVVVQGDASEKTLGLIQRALVAHDATLAPKVVAAVQDAKKRRVLA